MRRPKQAVTALQTRSTRSEGTIMTKSSPPMCPRNAPAPPWRLPDQLSIRDSQQKHIVAVLEAIRVVVRLEVVQIGVHDAESAVFATAPLNLLLYGQVPRQTRKRIDALGHLHLEPSQGVQDHLHGEPGP